MHEPDRKNELADLTDEQLTELFQVLRCPGEEISPRPGFYAKVMERIETQQKSSIWSIFLEPVFSQRLAFASLAMILLLGVALFSGPQQEEADVFAFDNGSPTMITNENQAAPVLGGGAAANVDALRAEPVALMDAEQVRDVVLVDLVTYQEQ